MALSPSPANLRLPPQTAMTEVGGHAAGVGELLGAVGERTTHVRTIISLPEEILCPPVGAKSQVRKRHPKNLLST